MIHLHGEACQRFAFEAVRGRRDRVRADLEKWEVKLAASRGQAAAGLTGRRLAQRQLRVWNYSAAGVLDDPDDRTGRDLGRQRAKAQDS